MKRTISFILLLCMLLAMPSCAEEDMSASEEHSVVFRDETITGFSDEISHTQPEAFPAEHGGKVVEQTLLDNGMILQEEILAENASIDHWCNILSSSGEYRYSVMPTVDLGYDLNSSNLFAGDIFCLTDALFFDDQLILSSPAGICSYDTSGKIQWMTPKTTAVDMLRFEDRILLLSEENNAQVLQWMSPADGVLSNPITLTGAFAAFSALGEGDVLLYGADGNLYAGNDTGLYQIKFTGKSSNEAEISLILDWMQSRISTTEICILSVLDSQTVEIMSEPSDQETAFTRYTMIPAAEVPVLEDVTLALFSNAQDYQLPIFEYNRANTDYRIVLDDYTVYDDMEQRTLLFNAELAAGNVPDMVLMYQYDNYSTTISTYERAHIFTDLTPLLQADSDFRYDELLSYITEPFKLDGSQYLFPLKLGVRCYFGFSEFFDGPVTVDEYLDICEREKRAPFRTLSLIEATLDDYYDEQTAVCTFNDGTLAAQINRAATMRSNTLDNPLTSLHLSYTTLFYYAKKLTEAAEGSTLVPVGTPNAERALCMGDVFGEYFAIAEQSVHKDFAVDFLQYMMELSTLNTSSTDNMQSDRYYSPPLGTTFYKGDIDAQLAMFEGKTLVVNGALVAVYDDGDPEIATADGYALKLTRELADDFGTFLDSITRRVNSASPVARIFSDEYWSMQERPIEAILDSVQSKASIYLAENLD